MKKIGILTFHRALNYGAILQTYALEKKMQDISETKLNIEVIDYRCEKIEKNRDVKQKLKKFTPKNIAKAIYMIVKTKKFDSFIFKNIKVSSQEYNISNLNLINNEYSSVVVGSDQIWNYNITDYDFTYLLNFNLQQYKKNSYAASMGICNLTSEMQLKYSELLKDFNNISVRENECMNLIKNKLNIDSVKIHLDPTLLLTGNDWKKFVSDNKKYGKYILVYNVPKTDLLYSKAHELSKKTGIKIISIPNGINPKKCKIVRPCIEKFLSLFSNAEYIITNSFHGTVFSIQFHKKFMVELRKDSIGNDRINTLLRFCNLENRILSKENIDSIADNINWDNVEKCLENERKKSVDYLKKIVEEVINNEE